MLQLLVSALFQFSVLVGGSSSTQKVPTTTTTQQTTIQSAATPTKTTNIGGAGWDDRN